jgi:hypothetical protein
MDWLGLALVVLFAVLIATFTALSLRAQAQPRTLRRIEAFHSLPHTVGQAVETGRRLHVSLGTGGIGDTNTAATLAGITVLDQISEAAAISDRPPMVTTADGSAMLLAQDTLHNVYARQNALARYDPASAQVAGLTPASFGAAQTTLQTDEAVAGTVLIGSIGAEAVLLTESAQRNGITTLAGSDSPSTQAMLYALADHPLIGEDLFAGGAYVGRSPAHQASLRAQDWLRLLLGAAIVGAVALKTLIDIGRLIGLYQ